MRRSYVGSIGTWTRRALLAVLLTGGALTSRTARAQNGEADVDTVSYPVWERNLAVRLSGSQAGYQNWTEGGINSLAAATQLTGTFRRISRNWDQTYESRLLIGVIKQDTLQVRKAEDLIRLKGQISYTGDGRFGNFNPTAAVGVRTQFASGYNYEKNPFKDDSRKPPVKVSDFFAPATFTQSIGLAYSADYDFRQRFGVAAKETVVMLQRYRVLYGHVPSQAVRFQLGIESQTELDREVFENVQVKSTLGLFAAFNQEELPDILWENQITMQVNRWLSADVEAVALYDRDISDALQIKEIFSIGISIVFM